LKKDVLILGSGKMARNIGLFLHGRGCGVTWLSRDASRLESIEKHVGKALRRLSTFLPGGMEAPAARFLPYAHPDIPRPDIVIETINESLEEKRRVIGAVEHLLSADALLLTNSSSIPPHAVHPRCIGLHFFYPVELTCFAEIILADRSGAREKEKVIDLARELGLSFILQDPAGAFAVNRLLLPLQAEIFRALMAGAPPEAVERASVSSLLPMGHLSWMDGVGLDVILSSVRYYLASMPAGDARDYAPLRDGLGELVGMGKLGKKNGDGLTRGAPLPWKKPAGRDEAEEDLHRRFHCLFIHTCFVFTERGRIGPGDLDLVLRCVFQSESDFAQAVERENKGRIIDFISDLYHKSGISYFRPADAPSADPDSKKQ
jgi:3-hydroxyacyl-CoA dehydrogenase